METATLSFVLFAPSERFGHGFKLPLNETVHLDFEDATGKIQIKVHRRNNFILW